MKYRIFTIINRYIIWIFIIIIIIFSGVFSDVFFTLPNLLNILRQISVIGLLSIGLTFVFIGGSFDLSVGAIMSFSMVLIITIKPENNINTILGILLALTIGIIFGCVNGFVIGYLKADAFIITLSMRSIITGLLLLYVGGAHVWVSNVSKAFAFISEGVIFKIPFPSILLLLLIVISNLVLKKLPFGRRLYGIGNSDIVSKLSGINVSKIRFITFLLAGFFCSFKWFSHGFSS